MGKYIDKDIVVTEIKKLIDCCYKMCAGDLDFLQRSYPEHYYSIETYKEILSFIDTLDVKDIDLDDKIYDYINAHYSEGCDGGMISDTHNDIGGVTYSDLMTIAKHFFELGMRASNPITAADRGIINKIISALKAFGFKNMISYDKEIEWLMNKVKEGE